MIGNQENPVHQRDFIGGCNGHTGIIDKLSVFTIMNNEELPKPDHAESTRD
jgi:hypothetical protein